MEIHDIDLPGQLEKHLRKVDHHLAEKFVYNGFDVYISEGGPFFIKDEDSPLGFYETAYVLRTNNVLFYQPIRFNITHDLNRSDEGRRIGRLNAAKEAAKTHADEFRKANAH